MKFIYSLLDDVCYIVFYNCLYSLVCFLKLKKLFTSFLNASCYAILFITEWRFLSSQEASSLILDTNDRAVIIYPHTTYWDFVFMFLARIVHPELDSNLYFVINEGIYSKFPRMLGLVGCIPATAKQRQDGGFIQSMIDRFKDQRKFKIFISPEGSLKKCAWRSGYYYLAKGLQCPIAVVGFNYATHRLHYVGGFLNEEEYHIVETHLQSLFQRLVPLYPDESFVSIINNSHLTPSVIGWVSCTAFLAPLLTIASICQHSTFYGALIGACAMVSFIYHASTETYLRIWEPFIVKCGVILYFHFLHVHHLIRFGFLEVILWTTVLFLYWRGRGRHEASTRTQQYQTYHSWFHLCVGLVTLYPFLIQY